MRRAKRRAKGLCETLRTLRLCVKKYGRNVIEFEK